jgi:hypothetical protein
MTKKRYIQSKEPPFELIEVPEDYQPALATDSGALWGDASYDGMRATDGTDISTRSKHRDYMRANNLTTMDDFKDTWAKAQAQRDHYRQNGGTFNRRDVERAIHQLQNRR